MTTQEMLTISKFLSKDNFVSVRDIQKSPTKALDGFKIVVKNSEPQGIYMTISDWENLVEDMEALGSDNYLKMIAESRESKKYFSRDDLIKKYDLDL